MECRGRGLPQDTTRVHLLTVRPRSMAHYDPSLRGTAGPAAPTPLWRRPAVCLTALAAVASAALLTAAWPGPHVPRTGLHVTPLIATRGAGLRGVPAPHPPRGAGRMGAVGKPDAPLASAEQRRPEPAELPAPDAEGDADPAAAAPREGAPPSLFRNANGAFLAAPGLAGSAIIGQWNDPHGISNALGLIAGGIWVVACLPQILKTFRTRSAADMSPSFAVLRVVGDVTHISGLWLIESTGWQKATAVYFLLCHGTMLGQWWAFEGRARRDAPGAAPPPAGPPRWRLAVAAALAVGGAAAVCLQQDSPIVLGEELGYGSSMLYAGARVPQILQILRSQRVVDLSLALFGLTIAGNVTSVASVVTYSSDQVFLMNEIPFLLASAGPILFDCVIAALIVRFSAAPPAPATPAARDRTTQL